MDSISGHEAVAEDAQVSRATWHNKPPEGFNEIGDTWYEYVADLVFKWRWDGTMWCHIGDTLETPVDPEPSIIDIPDEAKVI